MPSSAPISATFAKRLREARALKGVSQRTLGALVDKEGDKNRGSALVNRYEQQVNKADMDRAAELAKALDVPLAYLFADADDLAELILKFSKLDDADRADVIDQVRRRSE